MTADGLLLLWIACEAVAGVIAWWSERERDRSTGVRTDGGESTSTLPKQPIEVDALHDAHSAPSQWIVIIGKIVIVVFLFLIARLLVQLQGGLTHQSVLIAGVPLLYFTVQTTRNIVGATRAMHHLRDVGYCWVTFADGYNLHTRLGAAVRRLPRREEILVIPGYRDGNLDSLVSVGKAMRENG